MKLYKQYLAKNKLNYDLYMPGSKKQILQTIKLIKEKNGNTKKNI